MNHVTAALLPILIVSIFAFRQNPSTGETPIATHGIAQHTDTALIDEDKVVDKSFWLKASDEKLKRWYTFHTKDIKGFTCDDFVLVDTFHDVEFIELDVTTSDPALGKYRFASPSSGKQLDIYGYERKLLSDKGGKPELAAQSLDSEVAIYGKTANKKLRLLFCGSSCEFEDAAWIDDDQLLVAGTSSEVNGKNHPMIWGIKLSTRSVYRFMHPTEVPSSPKSFFNNVIASR